MRNEALEEAIGIAGGQLALADKIGVSQSLVSYWLKKSKKGVAAGFVLAIEAATGTPRERLRPDLYLADPEEGPVAEVRRRTGDLKSITIFVALRIGCGSFECDGVA